MPLPFITQPKAFEVVTVGADPHGSLEIKKLGNLSINERKYLKELTAHLPNLYKEAAHLAKRIASETGDSLVNVYNALIGGDFNYLAESLDQVLEFNEQMELVSQERSVALATTILTFRVDPTWRIADTGDADLIHPELVGAIAEFAANEEARWVKPEAEPVTEESLGNS